MEQPLDDIVGDVNTPIATTMVALEVPSGNRKRFLKGIPFVDGQLEF